jgi:hypothetical protein
MGYQQALDELVAGVESNPSTQGYCTLASTCLERYLERGARESAVHTLLDSMKFAKQAETYASKREDYGTLVETYKKIWEVLDAGRPLTSKSIAVVEGKINLYTDLIMKSGTYAATAQTPPVVKVETEKPESERGWLITVISRLFSRTPSVQKKTA